MATDHVFGEAASVRMSAEKSDHDYSYKTNFEIWRENYEFERHNISMSRPPLNSTPIGTNTTNVTMSHLDSTPIGTKNLDTYPLTRPTDSTNARVNLTYQMNQSQTHHRQTHHQVNIIFTMTENTADLRARDRTKIKSVINAQNRTRHTHCRATMIRPKKVTIDARDTIKTKTIGERNLSSYEKS